MTELSRSGH